MRRPRTLFPVTALATLLIAAPASATDVFGNINADTIWTSAGNPYELMNDVAVTAGVTLTIGPGVVIQPSPSANPSGGMDGSRVELVIEGTLDADASSGAPIQLTSGEAVPGQGDWYGVIFESTATGSLINAEVAYAVQGIRAEGVPAANLTLSSLVIHDFSSYGVFLTGGANTVILSDVEIHDSGDSSPETCLYSDHTGNATHTELRLHHCSTGAYFNGTSAAIENSLIYANTSQGVYVRKGTGTSRTVSITGSSLVGNGAYGVNIYDNYSTGAVTLNVQDSLVSDHTSYAFYGGYSSSSYYPTINYTYTDAWSSTGSTNNSYVYIGSTTGSMRENPLLVDAASFDFRPTERSPLRLSSSVGATIGAVDYDGVPTPGYHGFYWTNETLPAGTLSVAGDITITPGVTLTLVPGTTLDFAFDDLMQGGVSTARSELLVRGTLDAQGTVAQPIVLSSDRGVTSTTDWYGVRVDSAATALDVSQVIVERASYGMWLDNTDLAPDDLETDGCSIGVRVDGGNPQLTNLTLHDGATGLQLNASQADADDLVCFNNSSRGVYIDAGTSTQTNQISRCLVYDNDYGLYLRKTDSSSLNVDLDHCTITHNGDHGVYLYDNYSTGGITLAVHASAITDNAGYAFYGGFSSSSYYPSISWTYSDIWGNSSGTNNDWTYSTAGTGSFSYNPLYADNAARDFTPTHRSPLRYSDGTDNEIGYLAFAGDITPGHMGFYWEDHQFSSGSYLIAGDIVVTGRRIPGSGIDPVDPADDVPARVTVVPGANLTFEETDAMGGGNDATRVELVNHGTLEMDGISVLPVTLSSAASGPQPSDWYGVIIAGDAYATNVSEVVISHARYGVRVEGSDHIVKNIEAFDNYTAVYVEGGNPQVNNCQLHHNSYGLYLQDTDAEVTDLLAYANSSDGLQVRNDTSTSRSVPIDGCLLYDNGGSGAYMRKTSNGSLWVEFDRCTIAGNQSHAVYVYDNYSTGSVGVDIENSAITDNGGYAFYGGYSSSSYYPSIGWSYTNVWGNSSGVNNSWTYATEGLGNFRYNSLYKDPTNGDYTPTDRSPLRCAHSDGAQAAGYLPFVGDPTGDLVGYLHGDMTLTAAGSPYSVPGDLIIDNKCDSTNAVLTLEPGTVLQFDAGVDLMGGGGSATRGELRVVDDLVINGGAAQVSLTSAAASPAPGDWSGVVLDGFSNLQATGVRIEWASQGVSGYGAGTNTLTQAEVLNSSSWGLNFTSGSDTTVTDSLIRNNAGGGVYFDSLVGNPTLERNTVLDSGSYAVRSRDCSPTLVNNVMMGSTYGFYGQKTTSSSVTVELYNNTIYEQSSDCIRTYDSYSTGSMSIYAENNLLTWCGGYAFSDTGSYDIYEYIDYNNFYETQNYLSGSSHNGVTKGSNSTSFNPLYEDVDPSGTRRWYDLRLLSNSPMIDAGTTGSSIPAVDLLGTTRPQLSGIDIGAYEYDDSINHDPRADAGADQLVAEDDLTCFDAAASFDPDSDSLFYTWTFGDGDSASGQVVCHAFAVNVIHEVILTLVDEHGAVDHDVVLVDVNARPIADAGPEVWAAAGGDLAAFDGTNSYDSDGVVVAYLWDFGDGVGTSTEASPTYQYPAGPTQDFLVTLTVTDDDGHSSSATTIAHVIGTADTVGPLIAHTPVPDNQPPATAVGINASITDFSGVDSVTLYYRDTGEIPWSSTAMTLLGGSTWSGQIPGPAVTTAGVDYYIEAVDGFTPANTSTEPAAGHFAFTVAPLDVTGPLIVHTPVSDGQSEGADVPLAAVVTDGTGVATVTLYYKVATGSTFASAPMTAAGGDTFTGTIPGVVVTPAGVDYFIEAVDSAAAANVSTDPAGAPGSYHNFAVSVSDSAGPSILHTPVPDGQVEDSPVEVLAEIFDPSGVDYAVLRYRHQGEATFASVPMTNSGLTYSATIPGTTVQTPAVEYYIYTQDASAAHNSSLAPATAPGAPHLFTVSSSDSSGPTILHTEIDDGQPPGQAIAMTAGVVDSSGVASVTLFYRTAGAGGWKSLGLSNSGGDTWDGTIPAIDVEVSGMEYYLEATDSSANANTSHLPSSAPTTSFNFTVVAPDSAPPVITHTAVSDGQFAGADLEVSAEVTDTSSVAAVSLFYRPSGGGSWSELAMSATGDTWSATLPGAEIVQSAMDYYLEATDASPSANSAVEPAGAPGTPHSFTVVAPDTAAPAITHTAIANDQPAGVVVAIDAQIQDPSGVTSATLYYRATGGGGWSTIAMTAGVGDAFSAEIPAIDVQPPGIDYYLAAVDASAAANSGLYPATAPGVPLSFTVAVPDTDGPVISHSPISDGQADGVAVLISADVTDASGVGRVDLYYRPASESVFSSLQMTNSGGSTFEATIPGFAVTGAGVEYYLVAEDSLTNSTLDPLAGPAGPYAFTVDGTDGTGPTVLHTPVAGSQPVGVDIPLSTDVFDPSGVGAVTLYYRRVGDPTYTTLAMISSGGTTYEATLPGADVAEPGMEYYLVAEDTPGNATASPASAPATPYTFVVAAEDLDPPMIVHVAVTDGQPEGDPITVAAEVTDASGVSAVFLYHRPIGSFSYSFLGMTPQGGGDWLGTIPGFAVTGAGVEYYLEAVDTAPGTNIATDPVDAPTTVHSFTVSTSDTAGPAIVHTAIGDGQQQGVAVEVLALITDDSGIDVATLHYKQQAAPSWTAVDMVGNAGFYSATIPALEVQAPSVSYYIVARDLSALANESVEPPPPALPHLFAVTVLDEAGPAILLDAIADDQPPGEAVVVTATVTDVSGVDSVSLFYRQLGESAFFGTPMVDLGGDLYQGVIPGDAVEGEAIEYYLRAVDAAAAANISLWPSGAPDSPESFNLAAPPDEVAPDLVVTPVADDQTPGVAIEVSVVATDDSGVAVVTLYHRLHGTSAWSEITMGAGASAGSYTATIPALSIAAPAVQYYVEAFDAAPEANGVWWPAAGATAPASFTVTEVDPVDDTGPVFEHTAIADGQLAGSDIDITASITDPSGVAQAFLYYQREGDSAWSREVMNVATDGEPFVGTIQAPEVVPGSFYYYLEATDASPAANTSLWPLEGEASPFAFTVVEHGDPPSTPPSGCGCHAGATERGPVAFGLLLIGLIGLRLLRRRW